MGCSSSITTPNSIQFPNSSNSDKNTIYLIQQMQSALNSGDIQKQRSVLFDLNKNALNSAHHSTNPSQIISKLLEVLQTNLNVNISVQLAHISQLFLHQIYFQNQNGATISQNEINNWKQSVQTVKNGLQRNNLDYLQAEFELECIEAVINILHTKSDHSIMDYANKITNYVKTKEKNELTQLGKNIITNLKNNTQDKTNPWILTVITNYYTQYLIQNQPEEIDAIINQISREHKAEWHVIYGGIDIIEQYLEDNAQNQMKDQQIDQIVKLLTTLSTYQEGSNAWKIRNRVAQLCIRNSIVKKPVDQLGGVYLNMAIKEENKQVQITLQNAEYIKKQKQKLKESWQQVKDAQEQELAEQTNIIQQIWQQLNKQGEKVAQEEIEQYKLKLQAIKQQSYTVQQLFKQIDIKSNIFSNLQSITEKQQDLLTQIQQRVNKIETLTAGRSVKELTQIIYDYYINENQRDFNLYIPEKGVFDIKNINNKDFIKDVDSEIQSFIKDEQQKSMLIQGGAGTGKTLYCQHLVQQIIKLRQIIPIYINLPLMQNWEKFMLEETLQSMKFTEIEIQKLQDSKVQLLLVIDGYDEIRSYKCLYNTNNLLNWNCKTIFTCRSQHLIGDPNYVKYFISSKFDRSISFKEIVLIPFDDNQIDDYLQRFTESNQNNTQIPWKDWNIYKNNIVIIPGLYKLVSNPFILSMIVLVLPKFASKQEKYKNSILLLDLYQEFVKWWFENEEERMYLNNVQTDITNLKQEFEDYALRLATKMMNAVKTAVEYNQNDPKSTSWKQFFDQNNTRTTTIRRGVPIVVNQNFYCFIHKSIQEYFAVCDGLRQIHQLHHKIDDKLLNCSFNQHLIVDKGVFEFYKQSIENNSELKSKLFAIIELSKTQNNVSIAAANAITILNAANVSFRNCDFKNIKIPGANFYVQL
ncbi:Pentapeptide_repeats-containing protein [Hexamita inflata]|uniref:Pentapeptide repeats-containing protein n=1 Tax=Hexamita inflata TaxID=28002 RepID=A0AA86QI24_9EUKA|nr:Pentapeptide repeats-containing protein [Hexamita inflata]